MENKIIQKLIENKRRSKEENKKHHNSVTQLVMGDELCGLFRDEG